MSIDLAKAKAIFLQAAEQSSAAARQALLTKACGDDAELRQHVDVLVAAHEQAGSFLEQGAVAREATLDQTPLERPGTQIGPYKLLQQIGEGGMGVVWMAEQTQPVQRKAALKVIKPGMDSRQVIARFEAERQALAMMDHVSIARVLDAGATESGRPYFVMELVHGVPITKYCDDNHLTPRQRLELFVPVCQAIQHAHQKGIIHRDVKPSNVMITLYDGKPVPKVIDFGVAKAMEQKLTERTLFTQYGTMVGTLEYMSPEQAETSALGVDTRSDIYSLGVLLYELLTGSPPFTRKELEKVGMLEMLRVIREEEPAKPSTKLSTAEGLPTLAANRGTEPAKLTKLVRGELDWIVMKCLEKDRNRRYETANGFAMDLQHYLADEPVQACPPSAWYRFRKSARRNKTALGVTVLVAAALIVTVAILTVSNVWVTRERDEKAQALKDKETALEKESAALALAKEQEGLAKKQQRISEENELVARRHLYSVNLNLANEALESGQMGRVLELLEGERPMSAKAVADLRGFEWYMLWQLCHRGHRLTLRGHTGAVYSVAFSLDGNTLASASGDGTVKLWDMAGTQVRRTLRGHAEAVGCLAFAPDSKTLATGGRDGVKLWDPASGEEWMTLGRDRRVLSLAFSPDNKTLASGAVDGTVTFWDVATRQERDRLRPKLVGATKGTHGLAFSPDGKTLASSHDNHQVKLWNLATGQDRATLVGGFYSVTFSPDGKTVAAACWDRVVRLWDATTGKEQPALKGHSDIVHAVAFSPDGMTLASGGADRIVKLWDLATGQARTYAHIGAVRSVAFSPDGNTLASASEDGSIKLWDLTIGLEPQRHKVHQRRVSCLAFSLDSRRLASADDDGTVKIWHVGTEQVQATLPGAGTMLAFSPDGQTLASGRHPFANSVKLRDASTGQERAVFKTPIPRCLAFSRDGTMLAVGCHEIGIVKLWNLATGEERAPLNAHGVWVAAIAFSPDGKTLATCSSDQTVKLWDVSTGQERATGRHRAPVWSIAFSLDGRLLASGSTDQTVRLWDVASGQEHAVIKSRTGTISDCVQFVPDGKSVAARLANGTIKVWDLATRQERLTLKESAQAICCFAFSPDGRTLATAGEDGTVRFWTAATEQEVMAQSCLGDRREGVAQSQPVPTNPKGKLE